jgi:hypothetical protein
MKGVTKWLKKDRYRYQQHVKWYSWSIFIIIHALYAEIVGHYCNAHNYVADTCSYLSQRPSFVSFDECSPGYYWSSICEMGTDNVAKGIAGLCYDIQCCGFKKRLLMHCSEIFWCCMFFIFVTVAIICNFWLMKSKWQTNWYRYSSSVSNGIALYIDHNPCCVFRKRPLL